MRVCNLEEIKDFRGKVSVFRTLHYDTPITQIFREGSVAVGSGLFETLTPREIWIYTNGTKTIDIKHCCLFKGVFNEKEYYLLVDNTHFGVEFIIGLSLSEVWEHLFEDYHDFKEEKSDVLFKIQSLLGECLIEHEEDMYIHDRPSEEE